MILPFYCVGATNPAVDVSLTAVQNAYAACVNGDVLTIPSGTTNWGGTLTVAKQIWIIGNGTNNTILNGHYFIEITVDNVRISSIRFNGAAPGTGVGNADQIINPHNNIRNFRVDRCFIQGGLMAIQTGISSTDGYGFGVIDHNYFYNNDVSIRPQGGNLYTRFPQVPGSTNVVCIEDNIFRYDSGANNNGNVYGAEAIYHQWAALSLIRNNLFDWTGYGSANVSGYIDVHGNVAGGLGPTDGQSTVMVECYSNVFKNGPGMKDLVYVRGGAGLYYGNVFNNPGGQCDTFRLTEEDAFKFGTSPPYYQVVTNSFFWNNTYNGGPCNPTWYPACDTDSCGGPGTGYSQCPPTYPLQSSIILQNQNFWLSPPNATNGIPVGIFNNYTPLPYPHPLVQQQDGLATTNTPVVSIISKGAQTNWSGIGVILTASASGGGSMTYQWQMNSNNIPGATMATYASNTVQTTFSGFYRCMATNEVGGSGSTNFYISITNAPPTISVASINSTNNVGDKITLSVTPAGSLPVSYQWTNASGNIANQTNSTYVLNNAQITNSGTYGVVVTNSYGTNGASGYVSVSFNLIPTYLSYTRGDKNSQSATTSYQCPNVSLVGVNYPLLIVFEYSYDGTAGGNIITNVVWHGYNFINYTNIPYFDSNGKLGMWYLTNPPAGVDNIVLYGAPTEASADCIVLKNTATSPVFELIASNYVANPGSVQSDTLNAPVTGLNELVLDCIVKANASLWGIGNGQQTLIDSFVNGNQTFFGTSFAGPVNISTPMTWSGATLDTISHMAVALKSYPGSAANYNIIEIPEWGDNVYCPSGDYFVFNASYISGTFPITYLVSFTNGVVWGPFQTVDPKMNLVFKHSNTQLTDNGNWTLTVTNLWGGFNQVYTVIVTNPPGFTPQSPSIVQYGTSNGPSITGGTLSISQ